MKEKKRKNVSKAPPKSISNFLPGLKFPKLDFDLFQFPLQLCLELVNQVNVYVNAMRFFLTKAVIL